MAEGGRVKSSYVSIRMPCLSRTSRTTTISARARLPLETCPRATNLRSTKCLARVIENAERLPNEYAVRAPSKCLRHSGAKFDPERLIGAVAHHIVVSDGARVEGGTFDASDGAIFLGEGATVEAGALIKGPAYIGTQCVVRHGAYIRGDVTLGADCVVGGELKHMLALDGCELPHHGYCGDSLLGHKAHFGCGSVTANFPLFPSSAPAVDIGDATYVLGRRKFGAVVGDHSQLGCGTVTEPGSLLAPNTCSYPLCRLPRGHYGPNQILKNKPHIEVAPLRM